MLLSQMPQHKIPLGQYRRSDNQYFDIEALLYESPASFNFWLIPIDVKHVQWGHLSFTLYIPKQLAPDVPTAIAITKGSAADQVRTYLDSATQGGRNLVPHFSIDGWAIC